MKKLSILLLSIFCIAALASCDKGEMGPVANTTNPSSPDITSPSSGESFAMSQDNSEDTLMTIQWTEPDYGFSSAPTYTVEMGVTGNDFSDPMEIATVQQTSLPVITSDLNNMLLSAGFQAEQSHSLQLRIVASISDSVSKAISETVDISITPYTVEINYPKIYVPGSYQDASGYTSNWSPADAPALYSVESNDQYEGYVHMANSGNEFKFTRERNWADGDWGDDGADGTLDPGGANIALSNSGYYKMNVDLNGMTYSITNTQWGVIGSATANGWDSDQDMSYDPQTKVWTVTLDLTAGEMKFRANDAWDLNYGDSDGDGDLEAGGSNIPVDEAGNYTITLNLSEAPYTYTLDKN